LIIYYDESGNPLACRYISGSTDKLFYYVTNLQGDVTDIVDTSGNTVASYVYDAWGNATITVNQNNVAQINPIRYRGYYYDSESGLYYLISRYYDPVIGRFINGDSVVAEVAGSVHGFNLYAYCFNNPVNMEDSNGNWPRWLSGAVTFVAAVVMVAAVATGNLPVASAAAKVTISAGSEYIARTAHYNRNIFNNTNYTEKDLINQGYEKEPESSDKFHQNNQKNGERNRKYVIGDWFSSEVVYYSDGIINYTPEDEGTFNIYSGDNDFLNIVVHGLFDVVPYILWGNSDEDSTNIIDRITMIWKN